MNVVPPAVPDLVPREHRARGSGGLRAVEQLRAMFADLRAVTLRETLRRGHDRAMRLAIISDTHMPRGARAIPDSCLERCRGADAILHAGDLIDLAVLELLRGLGPPVHAIHGNVDNAAVRAVLPPRLEREFAGVRIGMVHAPGAASHRLSRLRAAFPGCQAVIFGHTHMPEHGEHDGFQIFNPGSPTERRRAPAHTMGIADITGGTVAFSLQVVA